MLKYDNTKQFNKLDYILIIGVILSPMTGLRLGKVGPSEGLVLLWCLLNIDSMKKISFRNYNVSFWIKYLYIITFGTGYALLFYPIGTKPIGLFTFLYLSFVSIGIYYGLKVKEKQNIESILYKVTIYGGVWYLFLYIYSEIVSNRFLGAPIWYGTQRFSGGGTNPHQIAVFLSAIIFASYYFGRNSKKKHIKYIMNLNLVVALYLGTETQSSTLIASVVVTFIILGIIEFIHLNKTKRDKFLISVFIILFFFVGLVLAYEYLYNSIFEWISSDPNGIDRFKIFETITIPFSQSPLIGLGPGTHARSGTQELHNTYLEILAMGGVLGFLTFFIYSFKIFNVLKKDYKLALIIVPLYIYGLAGFAMRRLAYWSILMIVLSLAEKNENHISIKDNAKE